MRDVKMRPIFLLIVFILPTMAHAQWTEQDSLRLQEFLSGKEETIVIYAKMCRGQMSRYLIKNWISDPETLKAFTWEGFSYKESMSEGDNWVFLQE